jgi:regulator of replication initiation timing
VLRLVVAALGQVQRDQAELVRLRERVDLMEAEAGSLQQDVNDLYFQCKELRADNKSLRIKSKRLEVHWQKKLEKFTSEANARISQPPKRMQAPSIEISQPPKRMQARARARALPLMG